MVQGKTYHFYLLQYEKLQYTERFETWISVMEHLAKLWLHLNINHEWKYLKSQWPERN